ncbi:MAG: hypothetical protein ABI895_09630 [Deltaproteobacteria bacterium]
MQGSKVSGGATGNTIRRCVNGFFEDQQCQFGCNNGATTCNACQGNGSTCINNGSARQVCTNGQIQTQQCPMGCVAGQCSNCNGPQCDQNGQIRDCNNGQLGAARSCDDGNACNGAERCNNNRCTIVGQPLRSYVKAGSHGLSAGAPPLCWPPKRTASSLARISRTFPCSCRRIFRRFPAPVCWRIRTSATG